MDNSNHPLAEPLTTIRSRKGFMPDDITAYLAFLYDGKLYETLSEDRLDKCIIYNVLETYAEIAEEIFWRDARYFEEALRAFPLLVNHVVKTELNLNELYKVSDIVSDFYDEGYGPAKLKILDVSVERLGNIIHQEKYKCMVYDALQDKSRGDYFDLINLASEHYGEDVFELFFSYAVHQPVEVLFWSHWTLSMNNSQCQRFIDWARSYLPDECLGKPISRTQNYDKTQIAVLERILSCPENTLRTKQNLLDFSTWGLSATHQFLPCSAVFALEDIAKSEWPIGSVEVLRGLFDVVDPNWTTWINKEARYTTIKERLAKLLNKL